MSRPGCCWRPFPTDQRTDRDDREGEEERRTSRPENGARSPPSPPACVVSPRAELQLRHEEEGGTGRTRTPLPPPTAVLVQLQCYTSPPTTVGMGAGGRAVAAGEAGRRVGRCRGLHCRSEKEEEEWGRGKRRRRVPMGRERERRIRLTEPTHDDDGFDEGEMFFTAAAQPFFLPAYCSRLSSTQLLMLAGLVLAGRPTLRSADGRHGCFSLLTVVPPSSSSSGLASAAAFAARKGETNRIRRAINRRSSGGRGGSRGGRPTGSRAPSRGCTFPIPTFFPAVPSARQGKAFPMRDKQQDYNNWN